MNKVYVVEGTHDEVKLKSVFGQIKTISVGGSSVNTEKINLIKELSKKNEIVLFLDPDNAGEKIRKIIAKSIPNCKHLFANYNEAISRSRKKVGIEHLSNDYLRSIITDEIQQGNFKKLMLSDLYQLGITGTKEANELRKKISEYLHIGSPNAKTLIKRLAWLKIDFIKLQEIIKCIFQKTNTDKTSSMI